MKLNLTLATCILMAGLQIKVQFENIQRILSQFKNVSSVCLM